MNSIGADTVQMIHAGLKALNEEFDAMVIGNQAPNFCVGANLMLVLMAIQEGEWDDLHQAVRAFQNANMALKYAPKPVVAAPFGLTLGGGVEISLHCARVRASAETYMGLVEVGVGIIPAGGGTKEMLVRAMDAVPHDEDADPFTYVKEVFMTIGMAKVSTSGEEARQLGYLSARDSISMNRDRQIADAKQLALDLVKLGYRPGKPREDILVLGPGGIREDETGAASDAPRRIHLGLRCGGGHAPRQNPFRRRRVHLAAARLRAVPARSRTRSFRQPLRPEEDGGAHAAHAEEGQAAAQLSDLRVQ